MLKNVNGFSLLELMRERKRALRWWAKEWSIKG